MLHRYSHDVNFGQSRQGKRFYIQRFLAGLFAHYIGDIKVNWQFQAELLTFILKNGVFVIMIILKICYFCVSFVSLPFTEKSGL